MKTTDTADPWLALRQFTRARIALGRSGASLPTEALLEFGLAHARAKDAVELPLERKKIAAALKAAGFLHLPVRSKAPDRPTYLRRPDLGRRLDEPSRELLRSMRSPHRPAVVFVIGDGLSSRGVSAHAVPLLQEIVSRLRPGWLVAPVVVAEQARVALGDEIGEILEAELVVMLIGERPGLSSPDSVGIYLTYAPRVGRTDAERNCISNVRPAGLALSAAADSLVYLLNAARQLKLSGVQLKDERDLLLPER